MKFNDIIEMPSDHESEAATIGACLFEGQMQDHKMILYAVQTLKPFDFYGLSARTAFIGIAKLMKHREKNPGFQIDIFTMTSYLRRVGAIHDCTPSFLRACIESCPSVQNIAAYVEQVLQCSRRRRLIQLAELMTESTEDTTKIIAQTRTALDVIEAGKVINLKDLFK